MICLLSHCGRPAFKEQILHTIILEVKLNSHLIEHELNDKAKSGWIETHEDEEVHYHSYHSIGSQLLKPANE